MKIRKCQDRKNCYKISQGSIGFHIYTTPAGHFRLTMETGEFRQEESNVLEFLPSEPPSYTETNGSSKKPLVPENTSFYELVKHFIGKDSWRRIPKAKRKMVKELSELQKHTKHLDDLEGS